MRELYIYTTRIKLFFFYYRSIQTIGAYDRYNVLWMFGPIINRLIQKLSFIDFYLYVISPVHYINKQQRKLFNVMMMLYLCIKPNQTSFHFMSFPPEYRMTNPPLHKFIIQISSGKSLMPYKKKHNLMLLKVYK